MEVVMTDHREYPTLMIFEDKLSHLVVTLRGGVNEDGLESYDVFANTKESHELHLGSFPTYQEAVLSFGESVAEFTKQTLNGSITNLGLPS